jgi:hypothetical protein
MLISSCYHGLGAADWETGGRLDDGEVEIGSSGGYMIEYADVYV